MTLGVRGKLFAVSLLLIAVVGLVSTVFLESQLRGLLESRIETEMVRLARTGSGVVEGTPNLSEAQRLAHRLGDTSDARITIIGADGTVLGDSRLTDPEVAEIENHRSRREVVAALQDGVGVSRRHSRTLRTDMLYAAVRYPREGPPGGVVRAAIPLDDVDDAIGRLRALLALAAAIGLVIAVLMSGLASQLTTRAFRRLVSDIQDTTRGARVAGGGDELGRLATSFQQLSDDVRRNVGNLQLERERLAIVLDSMGEALLAFDEADRITLANAAALELMEVEDSPVGSSLLETIRAPVLAEIVDRARSGEVTQDEFELPTANRPRVLARGAPISTGGSVVVMHDVTEMRRLELVRRDFVANVSHELRTPLSVIRANAETLVGGALNDAARAPGFLEAIERHAERLSNLVADLLDLSRIEAGEYKLTLGDVAIRQVADRTVDSLARDGGHAVRVEVDEAHRARADVGALEQILWNFVDNAVRYTPTDGAIEVRSVELPTALRIEVRDDGPGIEPHHRARIFERFYRVDPGRSRSTGGTGLGLAICKHLAENMGGRVGVDRVEHRGSCFWVELPRPTEPASSP